jgi:hypothetical protein
MYKLIVKVLLIACLTAYLIFDNFKPLSKDIFIDLIILLCILVISFLFGLVIYFFHLSKLSDELSKNTIYRIKKQTGCIVCFHEDYSILTKVGIENLSVRLDVSYLVELIEIKYFNPDPIEYSHNYNLINEDTIESVVEYINYFFENGVPNETYIIKDSDDDDQEEEYHFSF